MVVGLAEIVAVGFGVGAGAGGSGGATGATFFLQPPDIAMSSAKRHSPASLKDFLVFIISFLRWY